MHMPANVVEMRLLREAMANRDRADRELQIVFTALMAGRGMGEGYTLVRLVEDGFVVSGGEDERLA